MSELNADRQELNSANRTNTGSLSSCPTCGGLVRVETSDEGTSHYVPLGGFWEDGTTVPASPETQWEQIQEAAKAFRETFTDEEWAEFQAEVDHVRE